jgi:3-oxoacyl-[acyl-carrier-protein] synthase-3
MTVVGAAQRSERAARAQFEARFESIGAVVPEQRLSSEDLMAKVKTRGRVSLEGLTGIRERRVCGEGEDSYTLAVGAAQECLKYSSHSAADLEMIVCTSISKFKDGLNYVFEPALSLYVRDAIGARSAIAFDVANACAGMLTGVYIVADFIRRGVISRGMVVSGEYITSLSDNAIPKVKSVLSRQLASLTVGDCGAAVILERADPGQGALTTSGFVTVARWSDLCIGGACQVAPGGEMVTNARKIHDAAIDATPKVLKRALDAWGVDYNDIDFVIPHQTSGRAIVAGALLMDRKFGGRAREVVVNVGEYGNTASTSHFLAMYRLLREGRFREGENVMLIALASGLVMGVVAFTMDDMVERYG